MTPLLRICDSYPSLRFLIVGGVCAVLYFAICLALIRFAGASPFVATAVTYFICFWIGYASQREIAFRSTQSHSITLVRYSIWHLFGATAVSLATSVASTSLNLSPMLVAAVSTVLCGIASFFISSRWVFGYRPA